MELEALKKVLEESIKHNGIQPLTNQWLLNLIKLAIQNYEGSYYDYGDFDEEEIPF